MISDINKDQKIIYSLSSQEITFAFTQIGEEFLCGYSFKKTEHLKLVILEIKKGEFLFQKRQIMVENLDIFAYVNLKFVYVERHIRT